MAMQTTSLTERFGRPVPIPAKIAAAIDLSKNKVTAYARPGKDEVTVVFKDVQSMDEGRALFAQIAEKNAVTSTSLGDECALTVRTYAL